jgi:hypothetical protein
VVGIEALLKHTYFMLADEMGAGKTLQTIVSGQLLFLSDEIDRVIVLAPAAVRDVWYDEELGELKKHLFVQSNIYLYHAKSRSWKSPGEVHGKDPMLWIISNYEFVRNTKRLDQLLEWCGKKTLLVLDESSAVKNYRAQATKSSMALRKKAGRVLLLNGTPIANNPIDLFSQGNLMSPTILDCSGITHFRARYAEMGGYVVHTPWGSRPTQVVGWKNLEDLQQRFAPFVLRRLKKDCLDLPPVLPSVTLTAELTKETWQIYKDMRDEMVSWLSNSTVSVAAQTITKVMRLSQITSGFLGGLEPEVYPDDGDVEEEERPGFIPRTESNFSIKFDDKTIPFKGVVQTVEPNRVSEVGREKLDTLLEAVDEQFAIDGNLKLLVWCRFLPELARLLRELAEKYPGMPLGNVSGKAMLGKTKKIERGEALRLLDPRTAPAGPAIVAGTYGTGSLGLNFTACHTVFNCSFDSAYWKFVQSAARVDRPGQVHAVSMRDIVACGPKGEKTIDHIIVGALRNKEDIATWTTNAWVKKLTE